MTTFDSTTWLFLAIFAGIVCLIAVFVWGPMLMRSVDWETSAEAQRLDELGRLTGDER